MCITVMNCYCDYVIDATSVVFTKKVDQDSGTGPRSDVSLRVGERKYFPKHVQQLCCM